MYLDFYRLKLKPFQISTDPRFLWLGEKHQEALAVLKYGILDNKGFLLLTGDVGTGKTTLLNALVNSLGNDVLVAMVADPGLAKMDFFNFIADSFGMNKSFKSKGEFLIFLKNYLLLLHQQNRQALLIIDECQHLNQKLLEEVRLLSNIEKAETKLINIFFVGQNEFNNIILRPQNRAIRQRITINYNISALTEGETDAYIRFRLSVAGTDEPVFTPGAIREIHTFSNGYPRLINIICDQALLTGFVREKQQIDEKMIAECAEELKIEYAGPIRESDATPEAKTEPRESKEAPPSVLLPFAKPLAALQHHLQMKTPLAMALIIILIIWVGLITIFVFNQQRSNATIDQTSIESDVAKAATNETVSAPPVPKQAADESKQKPTKAKSTTGETEKQQTTPGEPKERAVDENAEADLKVGKERDAAGSRKNSPQRISLNDVYRKYGLYPEVHFDVDSNKLDAKAYEVLGMIAQYCLQRPETLIILRGYTDQTGLPAYNLKLSEFRADMVKTYLVGRGVRGESISTVAVGPGDEGPAGTKVPLDGERRKVVIEIIAPTG